MFLSHKRIHLLNTMLVIRQASILYYHKPRVCMFNNPRTRVSCSKWDSHRQGICTVPT